jgi:hypothetical protein
MLFVSCDQNGRINGYRNIPEEDQEIIAFYRKTERLIPSPDFEPNHNEYYITASDALKERPRMALTVSGAFISGIPVPCTCTVNGHAYEVNDESMEFESPCPGRYELKFEKWPYISEVVTVEIAPRTD